MSTLQYYAKTNIGSRPSKRKEALQSFIAKHLFERQSFYRQANHIISSKKQHQHAYSGALGYFAPNGDFDFNVVFRKA